MAEIIDIPTEKLEIDPKNIRVDPQLDPEFVESVGEGVRQNLMVRPKPGSEKYLVTVGKRRFLAGKNAGRESFPCKIRGDLEGKDGEAMAESILENVKRRDIPEWRWPDILQDLGDELDLDLTKKSEKRKIARKTGLSYHSVHRYVKILSLPDWVREMMKESEERDLDDWQEALLKKASKRSDSEKEALEGKGIPKDAPSIDEQSETLSSPKKARKRVLGSRVAAGLAESDVFQGIRKESKVEAFRTVLEAVKKGQSGLDDVLDAAETRVAEAEVRGRRKSADRESGSGERQKITVELDKCAYEAAKRMAEEEGWGSVQNAVFMGFVSYVQREGYYER